MSKRRLSQVLIAAVTAAVPSLAAAQTVYTGPNNGDYNTIGNWSGGVPTAALDARINNNASNVNVNLAVGQDGYANNLVIDGGDSLTLNNNSALHLSSNLSGAGTLKFITGANRAYLYFTSPTATIAAGSTIDFNYQGGPNADGAIRGPASGTLTNSGLVRGSGTLDNIRFTNSTTGILENYQTSAQLYLDSSNVAAGLFVNAGTIRAQAGSLVTFAGDFGGDFINTGGLIQANGVGSVVRLINSASITGGTYSTTGGGQIAVDVGQTASVSNFTNAGLFVLRNNSQLNVSGTITNTGSINFTQPYTSEAILNIAADTTLAGSGGVIQMDYSNVSGNPAGVISGAGTLTVGSAQTIRGVGSLRNLRVNNAGVIDANSSAAAALGAGIYLDPNNQAAGLFVNTGTLRSSAGGLLVLTGDNGGDFINTTGTIAAIGAGSVTELYNSTAITGGTLTSSGGGVIRVRPNSDAFINGPVTLTPGTTLSVPATAATTTYLHANGVFTNTGSTIELNANGNLSLLTLNGNLSILGGTISCLYTANGASPGARIDTNTNTLTLSATTTTQGVVYFNNARVVNNGTINANNPAGILADASNQGAGLFVNNGLMEATAGGLLAIVGDSGGDYINTGGTITSTGNNSVVELRNGAAITGGTLSTNSGGVMRIRPNDTATLNGPITLTPGSKFSVPATPATTTYLYANGTLTNTGSTVELNANGNLSLLSLNGNLNIVGGTLSGLYTNVNNNVGPRIDTNTNTLTLSSTTTTQGVIYFNNARVVNNGIINATSPAGINVDPSNQGPPDLFVNNNLMEATGGGRMALAGDNGGGLANTTGTILSTGAGSVVELNNGIAITGGTLTTSNGGYMGIRLNDIATLNGPITLTGGTKFTVPTSAASSTYLNANGTFINNGTIELNAAGNLSLLNLNGNLTLNGTGSLNGVYSGTGPGPRIDTGANTLTIGASQTVAGVVYFNSDRVINNGTILANVHAVPTAVGSFDMYIDASNQGGALFVNNGTIHAANNAAIGIAGDNGGTFGGTGPLIVDAEAVISSYNSASGDMGPVSGAGTYRADQSANLSHQNFRVATLEAGNNATARITAGGGNLGTSKVNTLSINLPTTGHVDVTDHGLIVDYTGASPAATIRAYLSVGRNGGTWNGAGINSSTANVTPGRAVGYGEANVVFATPTTFLGQSIDASSILIRYTINGDTNLDGNVNFSDLLKVAQKFSSTAAVWTDGDFNYDNVVDFADLLVLAQNFNGVLSTGSLNALNAAGGSGFAGDWALAQSMAPEPMSLLAGMSVFSLVSRRNRRG